MPHKRPLGLARAAKAAKAAKMENSDKSEAGSHVRTQISRDLANSKSGSAQQDVLPLKGESSDGDFSTSESKFSEKDKNSKGGPEEGPGALDVSGALNIELDDEASDTPQDDELAEIYGLFKVFDQPGSDIQRLAHGIVHESDALLRARKRLPSTFHLVYGLALLTLSKFQDTDPDDPDSSSAFVSAAIDRFDVGIDADPQNADLAAAKSAALVYSVAVELSLRKKRSKQVALLLKSRSVINESIALLTKAASFQASEKRLRDTSETLLEFAVSLESLPSSSEVSEIERDLYAAVSAQYTKMVDSSEPETARLANKGLGIFHLSLATPLLAELEGDEDDEDSSSAGDSLPTSDLGVDAAVTEKAKVELSKAIEYLEKGQSEHDAQSYVQLAEARISLGNLEPLDSEAQQSQYQKAVRLLKKGQRLGAGSFHELIESLE